MIPSDERSLIASLIRETTQTAYRTKVLEPLEESYPSLASLRPKFFDSESFIHWITRITNVLRPSLNGALDFNSAIVLLEDQYSAGYQGAHFDFIQLQERSLETIESSLFNGCVKFRTTQWAKMIAQRHIPLKYSQRLALVRELLTHDEFRWPGDLLEIDRHILADRLPELIGMLTDSTIQFASLDISLSKRDLTLNNQTSMFGQNPLELA